MVNCILVDILASDTTTYSRTLYEAVKFRKLSNQVLNILCFCKVSRDGLVIALGKLIQSFVQTLNIATGNDNCCTHLGASKGNPLAYAR